MGTFTYEMKNTKQTIQIYQNMFDVCNCFLQFYATIPNMNFYERKTKINTFVKIHIAKMIKVSFLKKPLLNSNVSLFATVLRFNACV